MALIAPTSMTSHSKHGSSRYSPPALLTPGQTLLWFLGGILAMFLVVSVVFAVKLGAEGRLPFLGKSARAETIAPPSVQKASSAAPASPPISSSSTPPQTEQAVAPSLISPGSNATFVPGTENILPPEVAHLASDASSKAVSSPPASTAIPEPGASPRTAAPTPAIPVATTTASASAQTPGTTPQLPAPAVLPRSAATDATPPRAPSEDIQQRIGEWASAWQRKDADAYLKHYADDFTPVAGITHADWLQQRRERLARPGEISVQLSNMNITTDGRVATARFTQSYSTQGKTLKETKTLALVLRDGRWLIRQERIGQ